MKTTPTARQSERAILVKLIRPSESPREVEESLEELGRLVESAGGVIAGQALQTRKTPDPAYYIGKGKAEEIRLTAEERRCDLVIFDDDLSPAQVRNLERSVGKRVLDRSELILDIFAQRARTDQAKLQVELAQLQYLLPRLTRMWEHLSRIRGGIGLRGPGETQLEVDRRVVRKRIGHLTQRLEQVRGRRERQRDRRSSAFNIAIVGYTNAGKSTLFNLLTRSQVATGDRLFETLDARTRSFDIDSPRGAVITDTVGFIRKIPHHLIASFRATLEEVVEADLLLLVVDVSLSGKFDHMIVVREVLSDLGIDDKPVIHVFNKIDLPGGVEGAREMRLHHPDGIFISAALPLGIEDLVKAIGREIRKDEVLMEYSFPATDTHTLSRLYEEGKILQKSTVAGMLTVRVRMEREAGNRLLREGISGIPLD